MDVKLIPHSMTCPLVFILKDLQEFYNDTKSYPTKITTRILFGIEIVHTMDLSYSTRASTEGFFSVTGMITILPCKYSYLVGPGF
jgi:hypothetical protein